MTTITHTQNQSLMLPIPPAPRFVAIRLFNNPDGWVANFTGSDIAQRFNRLD